MEKHVVIKARFAMGRYDSSPIMHFLRFIVDKLFNMFTINSHHKPCLENIL